MSRDRDVRAPALADSDGSTGVRAPMLLLFSTGAALAIVGASLVLGWALVRFPIEDGFIIGSDTFQPDEPAPAALWYTGIALVATGAALLTLASFCASRPWARRTAPVSGRLLSKWVERLLIAVIALLFTVPLLITAAVSTESAARWQPVLVACCVAPVTLWLIVRDPE